MKSQGRSHRMLKKDRCESRRYDSLETILGAMKQSHPDSFFEKKKIGSKINII